MEGLFKIVVFVLSVAGDPLGISFSVKPYNAADCAANMLAATREVAKSFGDQKITTRTACIPVPAAEELRKKIEKQNAATDKLYDL